MSKDAARLHLAVALDLATRESILEAARTLAPEAGVLKLGLEAFVSQGPELVRGIAGTGARVFLDLKIHDIPNTVGRAAAAAVATGASIVNCHAAGGPAMMTAFGEEARVAAAKAGLPRPSLIAVTVLTSLDAAALAAVGLAGTPREAALRLAVLARNSGLDGVVCSPEETAAIRAACGSDFLLVVPGVRPAGAESGDQKRVATPGDAIRAGADLLVVGRPILGAPDRVAAARGVVAEIAAALEGR
ncbi:MAG TPA: orotidine-5'-phosphate decarboxylase [Thermoanaerobaculia bacterium]|nr:orotidine-5'-phosphate decarboxylase [Thermoanaerobaculia bacterium]